MKGRLARRLCQLRSARIDRRLMQLVRLSPPVLGLAGRPRMELPDMVIVANCAPSR